MFLVDVEARDELQRYLSTIAHPWDNSRRLAEGQWWVRHPDGVWVTQQLVPERMDEFVRADGRRPDMVIGEDIVNLYGKKRAMRATQSDIKEAFRGLRQSQAFNPDGSERIDFKNIPLKNKDGSLSKYGKRLIELHERERRVEQEIAQQFSAIMPGYRR